MGSNLEVCEVLKNCNREKAKSGAPKRTISELFSPISSQACLRLISLLG